MHLPACQMPQTKSGGHRHFIMKKEHTNTALVNDLMEFSPFGALTQVFIVDAIQSKCNRVIDQQEKLIAEGHPFIEMEAWVGCAKDIKTRIDEFYK